MTHMQAWILRCTNNNCQLLAQGRSTEELNVSEVQEAEILILKACQQEVFHDEYQALIHQKSLPTHSKLRMLNPVLDECGLMRSNSRIVNADMLPFNTRYPVILLGNTVSHD